MPTDQTINDLIRARIFGGDLPRSPQYEIFGGKGDGAPCACRDEPSEYILPLYAIEEHWMMTKIYVGNLPFSATDGELRNLFGQHGMVESVSLPTDRETGRPRGFGFIEMSQADARRAIQALNGQKLEERQLRVSEAQDKPRGGGNYRAGSRHPASAILEK